jgi:hypothetical protein
VDVEAGSRSEWWSGERGFFVDSWADDRRWWRSRRSSPVARSRSRRSNGGVEDGVRDRDTPESSS